MFNLIDIGERAGSSIPNIYHIWDKQGWEPPVIAENFKPERITLSLSLGIDSKKVRVKRVDKVKISDLQKKTIVEYLTAHIAAKMSELAQLLGVTETKIRSLIKVLIAEDIVVAEGANKNRTYRLKR